MPRGPGFHGEKDTFDHAAACQLYHTTRRSPTKTTTSAFFGALTEMRAACCGMYTVPFHTEITRKSDSEHLCPGRFDRGGIVAGPYKSTSTIARRLVHAGEVDFLAKPGGTWQRSVVATECQRRSSMAVSTSMLSSRAFQLLSCKCISDIKQFVASETMSPHLRLNIGLEQAPTQ